MYMKRTYYLLTSIKKSLKSFSEEFDLGENKQGIWHPAIKFGNLREYDQTELYGGEEKFSFWYIGNQTLGAKYLGFFSSRSLKMREKYISFAQLVLLSLYIF